MGEYSSEWPGGKIKIFQNHPLSKIRIFWKNIHPCLCQADLMSMVTGSIALMSCSMITNTGPQRAGEDGLQSGHLQQHDHRLRETRHQGLHLDDAQGWDKHLQLLFNIFFFRQRKTGRQAQSNAVQARVQHKTSIKSLYFVKQDKYCAYYH